MIRYSIVRCGTGRVAAVLVERKDLVSPRAEQLIRLVGDCLELPVMLVALDETLWAGARVRAYFEAEPYLYALIAERDVDWRELAVHLDTEAA